MAQKRSTSEPDAKPPTKRPPSGKPKVPEQGGQSRSAEAQEESAAFNARVARKAFEFFQRRGADHGHDLEDWLEAERLVKEEMGRD